MSNLPPIRLQAVLKLDGFCNARCHYCYETGRLHMRNPMPIEVLERAARQLAAFASDLAVSVRHPVDLGFILHGGEPLVLPLSYLAEVLGVLSEARVVPASLSIGVQTNALGTREAALDLLAHHNVAVSVSNDVIPGARVTVGGKPMEGLIAENIARIAERGLLVGGITVLSRVTAGSLPEVHAYWEGLGVPYRLLPLFRNGGPRVEAYGITEDETCDALAELTGWLLDTGRPARIDPIRPALEVALAHLAGLRVPRLGSLPFGRNVLVVNNEGSVYDEAATDYAPEARLGSIVRQDLTEILYGEPMRRQLAADADEERAGCSSCELRSACSGAHLRRDNRRTARCGFHYALTVRLLRALRDRGVGREDARAILLPEASGDIAA
jgi:uncharacterized protein